MTVEIIAKTKFPFPIGAPLHKSVVQQYRVTSIPYDPELTEPAVHELPASRVITLVLPLDISF